MRLLLRIDPLKESNSYSGLGSQDLFVLNGNIYELAKLGGMQVFSQ